MLDLIAGYKVEGLTMPYTMEEYIEEIESRIYPRELIDLNVDGLTLGQIVRLTPEQIIEMLRPDQCLESIGPQASISGGLQLRGALRLAHLGAPHMLTSDKRKTILAFLDEARNARPASPSPSENPA